MITDLMCVCVVYRPTAGYITLCKNAIEVFSADELISTAKHEVLHALVSPQI